MTPGQFGTSLKKNWPFCSLSRGTQLPLHGEAQARVPEGQETTWTEQNMRKSEAVNGDGVLPWPLWLARRQCPTCGSSHAGHPPPAGTQPAPAGQTTQLSPRVSPMNGICPRLPLPHPQNLFVSQQVLK